MPDAAMSDEPDTSASRKIIHVDMDAFYASVEQRDDSDLRGRPVIVGGAPDRRGVVAAASYEARRFGIHSAMPSARAVRLCPHAVFIRPRFEVYRSVSRQIRAIFNFYTPFVEPLSLDEAYLDVTETRGYKGSATLIAREIKRRIKAETGLTASAGVSYNKFLAKLASDMDKPDGLYVIKPDAGEAFVASLAVGRFHGVGAATEASMKALGIHTGADLRKWSLEALQVRFGKRASFYFHIARGEDFRPVEPRRERKSLGSETTFAEDLSDPAEMLARIEPLAADVARELSAKNLQGYTLTLKVKYADFQQITRSQTRAEPYREAGDIMSVVPRLLGRTEVAERPVRLLGVTVSALEKKKVGNGVPQLGLF